MPVRDYFQDKEITIPHQFIRKNLEIVLGDATAYAEFFQAFLEYFLHSVLTPTAYQWAMAYLHEEPIESENLKYLQNSFRRIFSNQSHLKGLVGEHLLAFYYAQAVDNYIDGFGAPKAGLQQNQESIILYLSVI